MLTSKTWLLKCLEPREGKDWGVSDSEEEGGGGSEVGGLDPVPNGWVPRNMNIPVMSIRICTLCR